MNELFPIGTTVALLPETMGETVKGTIAGYCVYAHPIEGIAHMEPGYIVHLEIGATLERLDLARGARPYVGTLVCHVESVTALVTV